MKKNGDKLVEAISILYEDNDLVAIDKPGGVVVNNASSVSGPTIQDWWSAKISKLSLSENWQALVPSDFNNEYGTPEEVFAQRSGVVHRLDKDTSGVLLLAKNPGALINLLAQFKQRQVHKTYLCLVYGRLAQTQGVIDIALERNPRNKQKMSVSLSGRPATTQYQLKQLFRLTESIDANQDYLSLVECHPQSGRMHQIRVHLAYLGHPLVGDEKYAGRKRFRRHRKLISRQFLHASQVKFIHPRTNQILIIESQLPPDLTQVIQQLKFIKPLLGSHYDNNS